MTKLQTVVFDTKPYDRESLQRASSNGEIEWRFMDWRLSAETAASASGARAVCIFVNDRADRACLEALASSGVEHVTLRCAGFNGVDLAAAKELGLSVTRVPAYSPYAVAEHTVALLLALNRKIPRASNRVRDLNFSLNGLVGFDLHAKTAGIFGTGKIGRVAAQILRGFGMKVLAFDHSHRLSGRRTAAWNTPTRRRWPANAKLSHSTRRSRPKRATSFGAKRST